MPNYIHGPWHYRPPPFVDQAFPTCCRSSTSRRKNSSSCARFSTNCCFPCEGFFWYTLWLVGKTSTPLAVADRNSRNCPNSQVCTFFAWFICCRLYNGGSSRAFAKRQCGRWQLMLWGRFWPSLGVWAICSQNGGGGPKLVSQFPRICRLYWTSTWPGINKP